MNQYHSQLKASAVLAANRCNANFGDFMRDGFQDFLIEWMKDDHDPLDIVVNLLEQMADCSHRKVLVVTVTHFLQQTIFRINDTDTVESAKALVQILSGNPSRNDFCNWADAWYAS